jgi:hypothetical protein
MRNFILRLVLAFGVLGAVTAGASAAPTLNGITAPAGQRADVIQADYYYHHHHYHHRHWDHDHYHYY